MPRSAMRWAPAMGLIGQSDERSSFTALGDGIQACNKGGSDINGEADQWVGEMKAKQKN